MPVSIFDAGCIRGTGRIVNVPAPSASRPVPLFRTSSRRGCRPGSRLEVQADRLFSRTYSPFQQGSRYDGGRIIARFRCRYWSALIVEELKKITAVNGQYRVVEEDADTPLPSAVSVLPTDDENAKIISWPLGKDQAMPPVVVDPHVCAPRISRIDCAVDQCTTPRFWFTGDSAPEDGAGTREDIDAKLDCAAWRNRSARRWSRRRRQCRCQHCPAPWCQAP